MSIIFTRERAERLADYMQQQGYRVKHLYLVASTERRIGDLTIGVMPYASVWRGNHLVMIINEEWISKKSELL